MVTFLGKDALRILNQIPIAAVIIRDFKILYHNAQFINLFESDSTNIGEDIRKFQDHKYQSVQSDIGAHREKGISTISEYMSIGRTKDGKSVPIFVKAQSILYDDKYCSLAFLIRAYPEGDMDNIHRLRIRSLRKHQEFKFLQNLIRGLSHHINNKLAIVMGQLGMLQQFEDEIDTREMMGSLSKSLFEISEIIRNLKLFSGEVAGDFDRFQLSKYLQSILQRITSSFDFSYELKIVDDAKVLVDQYYFLIIIKLVFRFLASQGQNNRIKVTIQSYAKQLNNILLIEHELKEAMAIDLSQVVSFEPHQLIEYMFPFHESIHLFEGTDLGAAAGIIKSLGFGLEYLSQEQKVTLRLVIPKALQNH